MKWPEWHIAAGRGDFVPIVVGSVMLLISVPAFLALLLAPDRNSGAIGVPLLVALGVGIVIGLGFLVLGIQQCTMPGSLAYRIAHGRIFSR